MCIIYVPIMLPWNSLQQNQPVWPNHVLPSFSVATIGLGAAQCGSHAAASHVSTSYLWYKTRRWNVATVDMQETSKNNLRVWFWKDALCLLQWNLIGISPNGPFSIAMFIYQGVSVHKITGWCGWCQAMTRMNKGMNLYIGAIGIHSFLTPWIPLMYIYIYTYMGIVYKHIEFQVNFHETAGFNVSQKETKGASKETNSHKRHHRPPVETHFISPRYSEVFMIYALSLMQGHQEAPRHATPRGAKDELIIWRREMAMRWCVWESVFKVRYKERSRNPSHNILSYKCSLRLEGWECTSSTAKFRAVSRLDPRIKAPKEMRIPKMLERCWNI